MKRTTVFALLLLLFCFSLTAFGIRSLDGLWQYEEVEDDDYWGMAITLYYGNFTDITIPANIDGYDIIGICDSTFSGCYDLASVTIPEGIMFIDDNAFYECFNLRTINISSSVNLIADNLFLECPKLEAITVSGDNERYSGIDGVLFDNLNETELVSFPRGKSGQYTVPDFVTSIADNAFVGCSGLTEITIADSVTSIGATAFSGCENLTKVTLPKKLKYIGEYAFFDCKSLTSITIPEGLTSVPDGVFSDCKSLVSVNISNSVTEIGDYVFNYCESLVSINIPSEVSSIGYGAFNGCSNLESINVSKENDYYMSNDGVVFGETDEGSSLIVYPNGKRDVMYSVPEGIECMVDDAFGEPKYLTSLNIPSSLEYISDYYFTGCKNLEAINVSENNSVYSSVDGVLFNADKTEIIKCPNGKTGAFTIPLSVKSIAFNAFNSYNSKLSAVNVAANHRYFSAIAGVLYNKDKTELLFYPSGRVGALTLPNSVESIEYWTLSGCKGLTEINVSATHKSYTSIDGVLYSKDKTELLFCPGGKVGTLTLPDSVPVIGYYGIDDCENLTAIDVSANHKNYTSVDGVLYSKDKTELNVCPSGKTGEFIIPNNVTAICDYAFDGCSSLTSVIIPNSVKFIGEGAFWDCHSLTSIIIPDTVETICVGAFVGCEDLVIYTQKGSRADRYAARYDIQVKYL